MEKNSKYLLLVGVVLIGVYLVFSNTGLFANREQEQSSTDEVQSEEQTANKVKIEVVYDDENTEEFSEVAFSEGETALDVTKSAVEVTTSGEGEMAFVTSIGGVEPDSNQNQFWSYMINGELAQVGAGSYEMKDGDVITWELTVYTD